jgi:hypothetical protein
MAITTWRASIRAAVFAGALAALSGAIGTEPQALSIRTGTGLRYRLSQGAGEEQLTVISRTAAVEDAWLFFGDTWIDVGYQEEPKDVLVDMQLAAAAVHERDPAGPLAFYHLHPFHQDPRIIEPPSWQDVHSLALMKSRCGPEMIGIIFDGRGKWTFDITGDLEHRLLTDGLSPGDYAASHGYGDRQASAARFDREYPLIVWNVNLFDDAAREKRIRDFISGARQLGVIVTYAPR